ncbi:uncharacterized protein LOC130754341 [Actinidia eriantha]|uniref:uncharacterized protein LOC130754341 n=1 Tax=Actinidia eriantha TaxID=165200 RepID=UPI0025868CBD|nr:uncharacterized protein LOC130754341 [Actinidia eriantha]XP_057464517.1 uncharacterized protein LOC130754341 [Actinidia eriantha]XP_057464518.1 uncharacterized protein LOC130754341 [Actinidia eriantha]
MVKHSPGRNHRSKGIKVKHILQICVLLAVCFWLIYQVKHSHDKKKAFDEHNAKISQTTHVPNEILKFGRKDLHPRLEETSTKNEKHDEEEEEETGGEEEEIKHEDEEQEEDSKTEEKDSEGRGGGDDEIDENDQETSEIETERDEELIDEDKEREEGDERETEEKDSEDKEGRNENEKEAEEKDSRDGGSRSAHEAREENYKGDDASSAVTHDTETITTEAERGSVDKSNEGNDMNGQEEESKSNNSTASEAEKGEMGDNGISPNVTGKEDKGFEIVSSKSEDSLPLNSTMTIESNTQQELGNNSTEQHLDVHNLLLHNGTENKPDATEGTGTEDLKNNPNIASNTSQSDSNLIATIGESSNSSTTMDFALSDEVTMSNALVGVEGQSESLTKEENADGTRIEKSDASNGTDKSWDSSETGNTDEVHHDSIDSSVPLVEKDVSMDLDTLPEIRTEGSNNEDAAAE